MQSLKKKNPFVTRRRQICHLLTYPDIIMYAVLLIYLCEDLNYKTGKKQRKDQAGGVISSQESIRFAISIIIKRRWIGSVLELCYQLHSTTTCRQCRGKLGNKHPIYFVDIPKCFSIFLMDDMVGIQLSCTHP